MKTSNNLLRAWWHYPSLQNARQPISALIQNKTFITFSFSALSIQYCTTLCQTNSVRLLGCFWYVGDLILPVDQRPPQLWPPPWPQTSTSGLKSPHCEILMPFITQINVGHLAKLILEPLCRLTTPPLLWWSSYLILDRYRQGWEVQPQLLQRKPLKIIIRRLYCIKIYLILQMCVRSK